MIMKAVRLCPCSTGVWSSACTVSCWWILLHLKAAVSFSAHVILHIFEESALFLKLCVLSCICVVSPTFLNRQWHRRRESKNNHRRVLSYVHCHVITCWNSIIGTATIFNFNFNNISGTDVSSLLKKYQVPLTNIAYCAEKKALHIFLNHCCQEA